MRLKRALGGISRSGSMTMLFLKQTGRIARTQKRKGGKKARPRLFNGPQRRRISTQRVEDAAIVGVAVDPAGILREPLQDARPGGGFFSFRRHVSQRGSEVLRISF